MSARTTAFVSSVEHYENFPVASWLVPARLRAPIAAIYRFARYADDVADEGDASPAERVRELRRLGAALDGHAVHPVVAQLEPWRERHRLPTDPFHALLSAFEQDLTVGRYLTPGDVLAYCRRSANPVGELVLRLFEHWNETTAPLSDAICSGLQLVNFLQDVGPDFRRNRVYLPSETLAALGIDDAAIAAALAAGHCDAPLREAVRCEALRAAELLDRGAALTARVPRRLSMELRAVLAGARRVLERLAEADFDPIRRPARLRWRDAPAIVRLWLAASMPLAPALSRRGNPA